jgi:hypothetical protein
MGAVDGGPGEAAGEGNAVGAGVVVQMVPLPEIPGGRWKPGMGRPL